MPFSQASKLSFSKDEVVVAITHGMFGSHVGLAFHSARDGPHLVHLLFHKKVKTERFPPDLPQCWMAVIVDIPQLASKQLVGIVRVVSKRLPHVGFGLDFIAAKGSFNSSGVYKPPRGSDGLTCATFVTEIFRAAALPLIQEGTWVPHPDNRKWGERVCEMLAKADADTAHIDLVRAKNDGRRVRPEEVAASADMPIADRPASFSNAQVGAVVVMAALQQECPQLNGSLSPQLAAAVDSNLLGGVSVKAPTILESEPTSRKADDDGLE